MDGIQIVIVALSIGWIGLSAAIVVACVGTTRVPAPPYLYWLFFLGYVTIPSLYVAFRTSGGMIGSVWIQGHSLSALVAAALSAFCFSAGVLLANKIAKFSPIREIKLSLARSTENDLYTSEGALGVAFVFIMGAVFSIAFFVLRGVPMLAYFSAIGSDKFFRVMSEIRVEAFTGSGYLMQGVTVFLPIACLLWFSRAVAGRRRMEGWLAVVLVGMTIAMMATLTSRGHFAMFLILLVVVYQHITKQLHLSRAVLAIVLFFVLFTLTSLIKFGTIESTDTLSAAASAGLDILLHRMSLGALQMAALLQVMPGEHMFLFGRGYLWDVLSLLPGPDTGFNRWAYDLIYPRTAVGSNITPTLIGEAYANFGWLGIGLIPFMVGFLLQATHIWQVRRNERLSSLVFTTVAAAYVAKSSMNGLGAIAEPIISIAAAAALFFAARWTAITFKRCGGSE